LETCDLDRVDDVVGAFQDVVAICRSLNPPALTPELDQPLRDAFGEVKSRSVGVDEREHTLVETVDGEDVRHELASKNRTPGADKRDLGHDAIVEHVPKDRC